LATWVVYVCGVLHYSLVLVYMLLIYLSTGPSLVYSLDDSLLLAGSRAGKCYYDRSTRDRARFLCACLLTGEGFERGSKRVGGLSFQRGFRACSIFSHIASGSSTRSLNSPAPRSHWPPSITTHSPLMYSAMSLSRKAARLANSSWRPKRFMGCLSRLCSSNCFEGIRRDQAPSVGKGPGAMAFNRM